VKDQINLWLEITYACNYSCSFCYNDFDKQNKGKISPSSIKKILAKVSNYYDIQSITLAGGEPLIHTEILNITEECSKYCHNISLVTNGFFIEKNLIDKLELLGVNHIQVSFYGAREEQYDLISKVSGSLEQVIENLISIQSNQLSISAVFVTNNNNFSDIVDLLDILFLLEINTIILNEERKNYNIIKDTSKNTILENKRILIGNVKALERKLTKFNQTLYISSVIPPILQKEIGERESIKFLQEQNLVPRIVVDTRGRIRRCLQSSNVYGNGLLSSDEYNISELEKSMKESDLQCACEFEKELLDMK